MRRWFYEPGEDGAHGRTGRHDVTTASPQVVGSESVGVTEEAVEVPDLCAVTLSRRVMYEPGT